MTKPRILVVSYLPRGERSHTKQILDDVLETVDSEQVTHLDLLEHVPDLFDAQRIGAYIHRDYLGEELSDADAESLRKMDGMAEQLLSADLVVLATPMYNFSVPATVKAWFDSVMLKGKTWDVDDTGFVGLSGGRKALVIMSSGADYSGDMSSWDHGMSLATQEFQFMGFDAVESAWLQGTSILDPDALNERKSSVKDLARKVLGGWS